MTTTRPGVPAWKTGKPDAVLAAAVERAREELNTLTPASSIGAHLGAKREEDRVVTHLFESRLRGYVGWTWFAVLTRNARSKVITVSEIGLVPGSDAVLAPEWVPWSERVRPEEVAAEAEKTAEAEQGSGAQDRAGDHDADASSEGGLADAPAESDSVVSAEAQTGKPSIESGSESDEDRNRD